MKTRKILAMLLVIAMVCSLMPATGVFAAEEITFWDIRNEENITTNELTVYVDGEPIKLTHYTGHYYTPDEPNQIVFGIAESRPAPQGLRDDLQINIYVPEGATEDSAVLFILENASWANNAFPTDTFTDGAELPTSFSGYYVTNMAERERDFAAREANAIARGMIVVSYGARSRGQVSAVPCEATDEGAVLHEASGVYYKPGTENQYVCHTPATVADSKAAIRFAKYNMELGNIPGDPDRVFIVGHSGGGALATILGATGNSSDYDAYLTNAAPSTDDVYGVLASAPITDLPMADFGYEFSYGQYRDQGKYAPEGEEMKNANGYLSYAQPDEEAMALSALLAEGYTEYVDKLFGLSKEEFEAEIQKLLEDSVQHEIDLAEVHQLEAIDGNTPATDKRDWFELDEDGNVVPGSFNMENYYVWMMNNVNLGDTIHNGNETKGVIAFMGQGMNGGYSRTENNLWGDTHQQFSIAYSYLWNRVKDPAFIGVDKYADWDEFWAAEGEMVAMQMKITTPMPYLMGSDTQWYLEGLDDSGDDSDVAPNWFTRLGICDCDTSTAVYTSLVLGVKARAEGNTNCFYGWDRDHNMGPHYQSEFFAWMDAILAADSTVVSSQAVTVDGEAVEMEAYNIDGNNYFKLRDVAAALEKTGAKFSVEYNAEEKDAYLDPGAKYERDGSELIAGEDKSASCILSEWTIYIDGEAMDVLGYNIGGNNYFKLRDLGKVLYFSVGYDDATRTIEIIS